MSTSFRSPHNDGDRDRLKQRSVAVEHVERGLASAKAAQDGLDKAILLVAEFKGGHVGGVRGKPPRPGPRS